MNKIYELCTFLKIYEIKGTGKPILCKWATKQIFNEDFNDRLICLKIMAVIGNCSLEYSLKFEVSNKNITS